MKKRINTQAITNKFCVYCNVLLNNDNITKGNLKNYKYKCKNCDKIKTQNNYKSNKSTLTAKRHIYEHLTKNKVIEAYGGKCVCCNENNYEFLTTDHINSDGYLHRAEIKIKGGTKFYQWLIDHDYPKENIQLLCWDCNCSKGWYGYCPHQISYEEYLEKQKEAANLITTSHDL